MPRFIAHAPDDGAPVKIARYNAWRLFEHVEEDQKLIVFTRQANASDVVTSRRIILSCCCRLAHRLTHTCALQINIR